MQNNWSVLLLVVQFIYNITLQEGIKILLFKANYRYILKTSLTPRQANKTNINTKERIEKIIELYKNLRNIAKLV